MSGLEGQTLVEGLSSATLPSRQTATLRICCRVTGRCVWIFICHETLPSSGQVWLWKPSDWDWIVRFLMLSEDVETSWDVVVCGSDIPIITVKNILRAAWIFGRDYRCWQLLKRRAQEINLLRKIYSLPLCNSRFNIFAGVLPDPHLVVTKTFLGVCFVLSARMLLHSEPCRTSSSLQGGPAAWVSGISHKRKSVKNKTKSLLNIEVRTGICRIWIRKLKDGSICRETF